jgi:hypothetical protein
MIPMAQALILGRQKRNSPTESRAFGDYEKKRAKAGITFLVTKSYISRNRATDTSNAPMYSPKSTSTSTLGLMCVGLVQTSLRGEPHYNAIIDFATLPLPVDFDRKRNLDVLAVGRNGSVLVERPQFVELPEGIIPVGIPSKVWLKRVNNVCHCGWEQFPAVPVSAVIHGEDKKMDSPLLRRGEDARRVQVRQVPRQLVKRRAETTDEVPDQHGNILGNRVYPNDVVVPAFLKVILLVEGVRCVIKPFPERVLKSLQVHFRPAGFHMNMGEAGTPNVLHMA